MVLGISVDSGIAEVVESLLYVCFCLVQHIDRMLDSGKFCCGGEPVLDDGASAGIHSAG